MEWMVIDCLGVEVGDMAVDVYRVYVVVGAHPMNKCVEIFY